MKGDPSPDNYEQYREAVSVTKEGLIIFIQNFLLQFFVSSYGLKILSIDGSESFYTINKLSERKDIAVPKTMIDAYRNYYLNVSENIQGPGYDSSSRFVLKSAFCSTLPQILDGFRSDGSKTIPNYEEIISISETCLGRISDICRKYV